MPQTSVSELELADFLEKNQLETWRRERSSEELNSLVDRRLELLGEVEL